MKVLLVADIGRNHSGFYHVGDEAMFYETYRWYQCYYPEWQLVAVSRSVSHQNLNLAEIEHPLHILTKKNPRLYFLSFIARTTVLHFFHRNYFREDEIKFINFIKSFDYIHFTGGGNFYSHFVPWLYYVLLIIFLGKFSQKKIFLICQTIGPFNLIDKIISKIFINQADVIALREPPKLASRINQSPQKLFGMVDVSYTLPLVDSLTTIKSKNFTIGLSFHSWGNFPAILSKVIRDLLLDLSIHYDHLDIILIPHILTEDNSEWDLGYMQSMVNNLPQNIRLIVPNYSLLLKNTPVPAMEIKFLTAQADLILSSRYHGVIFSLSQNIPVIAFTMGKYYHQKNTLALELVYGSRAKDYVYNVAGNQHISELLKKVSLLIDNNQQEKHLLLNRNHLLAQNNTLFSLNQLPQYF